MPNFRVKIDSSENTECKSIIASHGQKQQKDRGAILPLNYRFSRIERRLLQTGLEGSFVKRTNYLPIFRSICNIQEKLFIQ